MAIKTNSIKILNLSSTLSVDGGGVARRLRDFAPHLERVGIQSYFLGSKQGSPDVPGFQDVAYIPELGRAGQASNGEISLSEALRAWEIDLVHVHEVPNTAAYAKLASCKPMLVHLQNYRMWCPGQDWFYKRQETCCDLSLGWKCVVNAYTKRCNNRHPARLMRSLRETHRRRSLIADGVHFVAGSSYMKTMAVQYGDLPEDQVSVVANVINGERFQEPVPQPDRFRDVGTDYVLFVGRLAKSKGVGYLIDAFDGLRDQTKLVVVGDGEMLGILEEQAATRGLRENVHFTGWVDGDELTWLYQNCRLVVVPSIWAEVFGNVGLEAMAAAKPVVAFDVGGISEWLQDGETGFLVPVKDIGGLRGCIDKLLSDNQLALQMGAAGRACFIENFSAERQAPKLAALYQKVATIA